MGYSSPFISGRFITGDPCNSGTFCFPEQLFSVSFISDLTVSETWSLFIALFCCPLLSNVSNVQSSENPGYLLFWLRILWWSAHVTNCKYGRPWTSYAWTSPTDTSLPIALFISFSAMSFSGKQLPLIIFVLPSYLPKSSQVTINR